MGEHQGRGVQPAGPDGLSGRRHVGAGQEAAHTDLVFILWLSCCYYGANCSRAQSYKESFILFFFLNWKLRVSLHGRIAAVLRGVASPILC